MTKFPRLILLLLVCGAVIAAPALHAQTQPTPRFVNPNPTAPGPALLKAREIFGPMAAIAISPFYSMACLSLIAVLAEEGYAPRNDYLARNPILASPILLGVFAVLALLITLPRFTKVTNTFGTFLGYLEDRAGLITLVVLQILLIVQAHTPGSPANALLTAGIPYLDLNSLMLALSIINYMIIRTVRFYFDLLILLSPLPLVDGILEATKKIAATMLLLMYAYYPGLAAGVNFFLLFLASLFFFPALRLTRYYQHILIGPMFRRLMSTFDEKPPGVLPESIAWRLRAHLDEPRLIVPVFPLRPLPGIRSKAWCWLVLDRRGLAIVRLRWFRAPVRLELGNDHRTSMGRAVLWNEFTAERDDGRRVVFVFSTVYNDAWERMRDLTESEDLGSVGLRGKFEKGMARLRAGYANLTRGSRPGPSGGPPN